MRSFRALSRKYFVSFFAFLSGCVLTGIILNWILSKNCYRYRHPSSSKSHQESDNLLLIVILSAPQNSEQRQIIRQTWLTLTAGYEDDAQLRETVHLPQYNEKGFIAPENVSEQQSYFTKYMNWLTHRRKPAKTAKAQVLHRFVVGTERLSRVLANKLAYEQREHQDLLMLDTLHDSYRNLTTKLLLTMDEAVNRYSFKYLLKCDDDTYVKLGDLVSELSMYDTAVSSYDYGIHPMPELYWGYFNGRANVKTGGQWKEMNFHSCDRYLPYALGGGYIITYNIALYVAENKDILAPYVSEDISMGTWLSSLRHIYRRHDIRFDTAYMPRKCQPYHIVLHKRELMDMRRLRAGDLCTFSGAADASIKRPAEYFYDWSGTPLKCCDILN